MVIKLITTMKPEIMNVEKRKQIKMTLIVSQPLFN